MQVYKGISRRQVGGGVWSTISRGIRPFLTSLFEKLKPHAKEIGKKVAKRAASSALNISSNLANEALRGNLNKNTIKTAFVDEVHKLKADADEAIQGYKRKLVNDENEQGGKGAKRRKMSKKSKKCNKGKKCYKRKTAYKQKKGNKQKKVYKQKRRTKRKSKVNNDIFGK